MVRHFVSLGFLLLMACVLATQAEKVMRPKVKEMHLWGDEKYLKHSIVVDYNDPHLNITLDVLQETQDVDFTTELRVWHKKNPDYYVSANTSLNLCRILNWRVASPIGSLLHAYMKEYGHLMEKCPITKGQYYIHKFWYPEDTASALFPEIDFDIKVTAHAVDANKQRTLILNDHIIGEGVVQDVGMVKRGILAMLPKAG